MRKPRITVRSLLVMVAAVAVPLGVLAERRTRFEGTAAYHQARYRELAPQVPLPFLKKAPLQYKVEWHVEMANKYALAARRPWLAVEPDTPEPR